MMNSSVSHNESVTPSKSTKVVRLHKALPNGAKWLLEKIESLAKNEGHCWASNQWLANEFGVTTRCIQKWLKFLKEYGLINVEVTKIKFETKRKIFFNSNMSYTRTSVRGRDEQPFTHIITFKEEENNNTQEPSSSSLDSSLAKASPIPDVNWIHTNLNKRYLNSVSLDKLKSWLKKFHFDFLAFSLSSLWEQYSRFKGKVAEDVIKLAEKCLAEKYFLCGYFQAYGNGAPITNN
jgi:hypothetical protein